MIFKNKKINCDIQSSECFRLRISLITFGVIACFLSIQGLTNLLENKINDVSYIRLYSILILIAGIISILLGCIRIEKANYIDLTNIQEQYL